MLIRLATHRPANDSPRVQIEQYGQIEPAASSHNGREVSHPDPIHRGSHEDLVQAVGRRGSKLMLFDHHAEPSHATGFEPCNRRNRATRWRPHTTPDASKACHILTAP